MVLGSLIVGDFHSNWEKSLKANLYSIYTPKCFLLHTTCNDDDIVILTCILASFNLVVRASSSLQYISG